MHKKLFTRLATAFAVTFMTTALTVPRMALASPPPPEQGSITATFNLDCDHVKDFVDVYGTGVLHTGPHTLVVEQNDQHGVLVPISGQDIVLASTDVASYPKKGFPGNARFTGYIEVNGKPYDGPVTVGGVTYTHVFPAGACVQGLEPITITVPTNVDSDTGFGLACSNKGQTTVVAGTISGLDTVVLILTGATPSGKRSQTKRITLTSPSDVPHPLVTWVETFLKSMFHFGNPTFVYDGVDEGRCNDQPQP